MLETSPISRSMRKTASFAPPCSGPYRAAAAPATATYGSARELPIERITHVERLDDLGMHLELRFGDALQHLQEVLAVADLVARIDERHAHAVAVAPRRERRHLRDQTHH